VKVSSAESDTYTVEVSPEGDVTSNAFLTDSDHLLESKDEEANDRSALDVSSTVEQKLNKMDMNDVINIGGTEITKAQILSKEQIAQKALLHKVTYVDEDRGKVYINHFKFLDECEGFFKNAVLPLNDDASKLGAAKSALSEIGLQMTDAELSELQTMLQKSKDAKDAPNVCRKVFSFVSAEKKETKKKSREANGKIDGDEDDSFLQRLGP